MYFQEGDLSSSCFKSECQGRRASKETHQHTMKTEEVLTVLRRGTVTKNGKTKTCRMRRSIGTCYKFFLLYEKGDTN